VLVVVSAFTVLLDRAAARRTTRDDQHHAILENEMRSAVNAAVAHFDRRLDLVVNHQLEHRVRLEENTGEIRAHVCPMLPADNVVSFELGREAGRAGRHTN